MVESLICGQVIASWSPIVYWEYFPWKHSKYRTDMLGVSSRALLTYVSHTLHGASTYFLLQWEILMIVAG